MLVGRAKTRPSVSVETFVLFRDLIYKRCGISLSESKRYLIETRLSGRLAAMKLKSFEDYYYYLIYDKNKEAEMNRLIGCMVTNETSFYRDRPQLDGFINGVIPDVIKRRERDVIKDLRVWSSASSTGEEPYTLAMMMMEKGLHLKGWRISVIGSDISDGVLHSARRATYEGYALRNVPDVVKKKYFFKTNENYSVVKKVKDSVSFKKINMMDRKAMGSIKSVDVVFCRNVLIYFDDQSRKAVLTHLYDSLRPGGYLFLGFSESLNNLTRLFTPVKMGHTLVYKKT
ncbi:MAG: CheR family methyltransferase [Thermodesulfobacteriota bacterium]